MYGMGPLEGESWRAGEWIRMGSGFMTGRTGRSSASCFRRSRPDPIKSHAYDTTNIHLCSTESRVTPVS